MLLDRMAMSVAFLFIVWLQLAVNIKNTISYGGGDIKDFDLKLY